MTTVFLSYGRDDDEPFVKRLYEDLIAHGHEVWWDRVSMPSRGRTFSQEIRDAIDGCERLLLVAGPHALASDYVRAEWDYALEVCKAVTPVLRLGDYPQMPPELAAHHSPDARPERSEAESLAEIRRVVAEPIPPLGALHGVPSLPAHFLPRAADLEALNGAILADVRGPTVITSARQTTALQGMGGVGKSVLAAAFCRACGTRRAFGDGLVWVTVGQEPDLVRALTTTGRAAGDDVAEYVDLARASARLGQALVDKNLLLVLDDVWDVVHADPFANAMGARCRLLVTTRDGGLASALGAQEHRLDLLDSEASLQLLAGWSKQQVEGLPDAASEVAAECGYLPFALALCGAMAGDGAPWSDLLDALREADLAFLTKQFPNYPYPDVLRALKVSVDALARSDPAWARHYGELAVFPAAETVPEAAVVQLWVYTNGLNERSARQLLTTLGEKSLLRLEGKAPQRRVALHDLQHDYLRAALQDLTGLHGELLAAYEEKCPEGWHTGPDDGYFFQRLAWHLSQAGRGEELRDLLLDYRWLRAKLGAAGPTALVSDFDLAQSASRDDGEWDLDRSSGLVRGALCLSAHVIGADPAQLPSQLTGRLLGFEEGNIQGLLWQAREQHRGPWLRPLLPSLMAPGGPLIRTFVGHSGWVDSLAVTPDGCRAVSGSRDGTLKVWDLQAGVELATMRGHAGPVKAVALVPDGCRVVSASDDGTLKVWNLETGTELATLTGHDGPVAHATVTRDGLRVVAASDHGTARVWDLELGTPIKTLGGNVSERSTLVGALLKMAASGTSGSNLTPRDLQAMLVRQIPRTTPVMAVSGNGRRLVIAVSERALEVHDLESDVEPSTLSDHTGKMTSLTITPDGGQVLGGSQEGTLTVWDTSSGEVRHSLRGHAAPVKTMALIPDGGRAISGARDGTMAVWDLHLGTKLATLTGHKDAVWAVDVSYDGRRAVSASSDKTLKVWDLQDGAELATLYGHTDEVWAVAVVPDGCRVLSGSWDNTVKLWDLEAGGEVQTQIGHAGAVTCLAVVPGGRQVVSTSVDKTLKVWDLMSGGCLATLTGHEATVNGVAITPDGSKAISASSDRRLKVWDLASGAELRTLCGHDAGIETVAVMSDGRSVLSGALDGTLKVWDLQSGAELASPSGHEGSISAVIAARDGRRFVSASYDKTLKIWDMDSGSEICTLAGHTAGVHSVALIADGHRVISAGYDKTLRVWDLESGDQLAAFSSDSGWAHNVAEISDGRSVVTAWSDKTLKVWNLETGMLLAGFVSDGAIQSCATGLDGTTVVAGDDLGRVHLLRFEGTVEGVRLPSTAPLAPGLVPVPEGFKLEDLGDLDHTRLVGSLTDAHRAIKEEEWHKATGYLNAALSLAPELDRALLLKGQCELWLRRWDAAERTAWRALRTLADRELGEDITEVMPQRLPWFVRVPNREIDAARRRLTQILENLSLARDKDVIEQAYRAMAKEEWTEALGSLDNALSKSPNAVPALFLKAMCHFRLEQWDAADEAARKALPLSATEEYRQAREQLLVLLERIALVQAQRAIAKGRWTEALSSLQDIRSESPDEVNALPALFLVAWCHFRLGEWDAAEEAARKALALCVEEEHEQYQERLLLLLEQTPLARDAQALAQVHMRQLPPELLAPQSLSRRAQALAPTLRAIAREEWAEALGPLDKFLSKSPNAVPALYLKAMCHVRLEEWDAAEATAKRALPLAAAEEYRQVREQLLLILEQTPLVRDGDAFEQAQRAMANEEWAEALSPLDTILSKAPGLVPVLYYKAICHFKLKEWAAAEEAAKKALPLCTAEHTGVQEQLSLLLEQTVLQRAMNTGEFTEVSKLLESIQARRATPAQGATRGAKGEPRSTAGLWVARLLVAGIISVALPSVVHPISHGILTVIGILSLLIQRSDSIAPYWGGALVDIGLLALLLRRRARLVLAGVALLAAGALNAFTGKLGGWTLLAVVQFVLGIYVLNQSRQRQQPDQSEKGSGDMEQ